jgi:hypothetical protein
MSSTHLRGWLTSAVVVLLAIFAANQFATEWATFRSSAYPAGVEKIGKTIRLYYLP